MKKCPFCGADIEENAQFCLYCMTSLTEKEQILVHKKKKPQGLLILAAIVGAAVILLLLLFGKRSAPDTEGQTTDTTVTTATTETTTVPTTQATTAPTVETTTETTEAETEPSQAASQPTTKPSSKPSTPPTQPEEEPTPPETEIPETHLHSFHLKYTTEDFLKSAATCESPAYYYYSCTCGQKSEETFSSGNPNGHSPARLEGYPADCIHDGKTDGSYCSVCQVILKKQEEIHRLGHSYPFSSSPSPCMTCGEMGTLTISCPPLPVYYKDIFRVNSGYYKVTLLNDGVSYALEIMLNYTNISSQTTDYFPVFMSGLHRPATLKPNESGYYVLYIGISDPYGSYNITFDWD